MTTVVALIAPATDMVEKSMYSWAFGLANLLSSDSRYRVLPNANPNVVTPATLSTFIGPSTFVFYFGHGKRSQLGKRGPVIDASNGLDLAHRHLAGIACHAGVQLGPDLVRSHAVAGYLGFDDQLVFPTASSQLFGDIVVKGLLELLDPGQSGLDALHLLRAEFKTLRAQYQKVQSDRTASKRQRYEANLIWLAAMSDEKTVVWI